jgi:hypothetical protein
MPCGHKVDDLADGGGVFITGNDEGLNASVHVAGIGVSGPASPL